MLEPVQLREDAATHYSARVQFLLSWHVMLGHSKSTPSLPLIFTLCFFFINQVTLSMLARGKFFLSSFLVANKLLDYSRQKREGKFGDKMKFREMKCDRCVGGEAKKTHTHTLLLLAVQCILVDSKAQVWWCWSKRPKREQCLNLCVVVPFQRFCVQMFASFSSYQYCQWCCDAVCGDQIERSTIFLYT